jgi:polar amino acid transport system substrate-binding protein
MRLAAVTSLAPLALALAALLLPQAACAGDAPATVTIAYEDGANPPWSSPDGTGVDHQLLKMVGAKVGVTFTMTVMPWKRCLAQMQENKVDGALNASFKEERLAMGNYPMGADGKVDPAKKLHDDSYHLFRAKGANLDWDGKAFANLAGKIGIQSGFSIKDQLTKAGAQVDEEAKDLAGVMKKLAAGRLQGAALHTTAADAFLAANPEVAAKVEKVAAPLVVKPYYLMLAKGFCEKNPELAQRIWTAIAELRATPDYQKLLAQ